MYSLAYSPVLMSAKIWDKIDPSLHDSSQLTFKRQYRDVLISAYDDR